MDEENEPSPLPAECVGAWSDQQDYHFSALAILQAGKVRWGREQR